MVGRLDMRCGENFNLLLRILLFPLQLAVALILSSNAAFAASDDDGEVYEGTVGKSAVVVELQTSAPDAWGRYYYRRYRMDIPFSGKWHGEDLSLKAETTGDTFSLQRSGKSLVGTLVTAEGKRATVKLTRAVDVPATETSGPTPLAHYDRLQLEGLRLVPGATSRHNGRILRSYREPISGIELFRIESGYPADVLARINQQLEQLQWREISASFSCAGYDGKSGMEISEARTPWLSDDYVSFAWFSNWTCAGAAHPDFGTQGHTYETSTGRELTLEDVFPVGSGPIPTEGSDDFYTYRSNVFAPAVVALLRKLYPTEMPDEQEAAQEDSDSCDYGDPDVWNFPSWYLTKDGLYLGAVFARVSRACDEPDWSIIPWHALPARSAR